MEYAFNIAKWFLEWNAAETNNVFSFQEFACNGTVVEHPEYGEVLQLQGDQRQNICDWLTKVGLVKADQLKVHGF